MLRCRWQSSLAFVRTRATSRAPQHTKENRRQLRSKRKLVDHNRGENDINKQTEKKRRAKEKNRKYEPRLKPWFSGVLPLFNSLPLAPFWQWTIKRPLLEAKASRTTSFSNYYFLGFPWPAHALDGRRRKENKGGGREGGCKSACHK
jgi:hypothetical protein